VSKTSKTQQEEPQTPEKQFSALVRRAEAGDRTALGELKPYLDKMPDFCESIGNMACQAEHSLINRLAGKNELVKETVERKLQALRTELAGPSPSPLERLLVDRIVTCWLSLAYAEAIYNQTMGDLSINQSGSQLRRIDGAHRRYLSAIKALAQVRRLALPALQVNIGEKQVNVAGNVQVGLGSNQP
jgi:hypothetical protein